MDDRQIALRRILNTSRTAFSVHEQMPEIVKLRISVARIAQRLNIDASDIGPKCADVLGKSYGELVKLAQTEERGWNELCRRICERIDEQ